MADKTIPVAQQRQMLQHIQKLRDSRQRVHQYEELNAGVETAQAAMRSNQLELIDESQVVHLAASLCVELAVCLVLALVSACLVLLPSACLVPSWMHA